MGKERQTQKTKLGPPPIRTRTRIHRRYDLRFSPQKNQDEGPGQPKQHDPRSKESAKHFGKKPGDALRYANYENRRRIIAHYVYTHPATIRVQLGLYRLFRDVNPLHFALERGWQIGSGKEMFTKIPVSRIGAALEFTAVLALMYGIGMALKSVKPQTTPVRGRGKSLNDPIYDLPKGGGGMKIGNRWYTEHALERMAPNTPQVRAQIRTQVTARLKRLGFKPGHPAYDKVLHKALQKIDPRGVPPSVVEAELLRPGSTNVRVISANRKQVVVTVIPRSGSAKTATPKATTTTPKSR